VGRGGVNRESEPGGGEKIRRPNLSKCVKFLAEMVAKL
jgi:hypothetical protein